MFNFQSEMFNLTGFSLLYPLRVRRIAFPLFMSRIRLTSKRQATFPARLCDELGVSSGDEIELKREERKGKAVWILEARPSEPPAWVGSLRRYAQNAAGDHSMDSMRRSIARARAAIGDDENDD